MRIINNLNSKYILFAILALAFILRIINFAQVPPSLNWDEVSHGYNAHSILKTGQDEWGVSWPTIFRAYGDYKLPVYIYTTAVSESIFGLNEFAVRLPSILAGVGIVLFTFLLSQKLFNQKVAVVSSLLAAFEPWSFFLSRGAFEANLAQFFVLSGFYYFLEGLEKPKKLVLSAVLLGFSVWTYNSARIFVPLLLLFTCLIYIKDLLSIKNKKILSLAILVLALFFIPMFLQLVNPEGQARYGWVAILDEGAISKINEARGNSHYSSETARLLHNKVTYFVQNFFENYISHFSLSFLFLNGGSQFQFNIPNTGLLYLIDLPFVLLGIWSLAKEKRKYNLVLLVWLILAPIASSLTREAPHTLRAITFLPIPMILIALGVVELEKRFKNKLVIPIFLLISLAFGAHYLYRYFETYPKEYSQAWQYGYKQAVDYAKQHYNEYDQIIITKKYGEPHEFILFYWPWDPEKYRNDPNLVRFSQSNWFWIDSFDKFIFVNDWEVPKTKEGVWVTERDKAIDMSKKTLIITSPDNYPPGLKILSTVKFLDGSFAFDILENDVENN